MYMALRGCRRKDLLMEGAYLTNWNRKWGEKEVSSKTIGRGRESDNPRTMKEGNDHAHGLGRFTSFLRLSRADRVFRSNGT